jgi:hypothetical protein
MVQYGKSPRRIRHYAAGKADLSRIAARKGLDAVLPAFIIYLGSYLIGTLR